MFAAAAAHQSGDLTGGGGNDAGRAGGILMATATAAVGGAFATTNQIDLARTLILSETRSGDSLSGHGNIPATNQTALEHAFGDGGPTFNNGNNNSELLANVHNNLQDHATAFPLSSPQSVLVTFSGWDLLLISVLISIILISIIGNCLVCVAIFTDRRLRKLGNAFIVSLAIADLFVSCLVMTFALCNDLMNYWMFGEWFCDIWISFDIMCCTASILNLCAISLDRFIHIKDCLLYNQLMTKRVAISAVIIIWIISALVSFVPINLGWHKPNHFKQPSTNLAHLNNLSNTIQASSTTRMPPPTDLDYHYDDATTEDDNKLALVSRESHGQHQAADRHKRQASTEHSIIGTSPTTTTRTIPCRAKWCDTTSAGMELNDKISEIAVVEVVPNWAARADYRRSQISNKLQQSPTNSHQHQTGDEGLRQHANMQALLSSPGNMQVAGNAPIDNNDDHRGSLEEARSPDGRRAEHLQGNESRSVSTWERALGLVSLVAGGAPSALEQANLVAQVPNGLLGDGSGNNLSRRRLPGESDDVDDDDDDDESKQRRQTTASHELHKNELFDQVAPPESNPELRRNRRRPDHAGSLLGQIKHLPPSSQMLNRYQIGPQLGGGSPVTVASLEAHTDRRPAVVILSDSTATGLRTKRSPQELNGHQRVQTNRPRTTTTPTTTATTDATNGESSDKVDAANARATLSTHRSVSPRDDHDGDNERQPTATDGRRQATREDPSSHRRIQPRQQRATGGSTTSKAPTTSELPQCMLTLTPTYAVISSTISFYIPCIIMLGLYSKLFACARRHVRNIKAISKAPQPIGFGSPPAGGRTAGQATNAISILNDCARDQSRSATSNEIVNGRQSNATSASSRRDPSSLSIGPSPTTGGSAGNSIGMQCRAKLARFVRRPELKLATKSRTWIKVGARSSATLKPNQAGTAEAELVLSTSSDVPAETEALTVAAANQKVAQSGCGPVLNKLNSNISKQNAQTTTITAPPTTTSYNAADYNGDENDHDKTNAHGNETEPFLNGSDGHQQQQQETAAVVTLNSTKLQVQPADDNDDLAGQINGPTTGNDLPTAERTSPNAKRARHKTLVIANSVPTTNFELNSSRTEANVGPGANQRPKIITTTYTASGDITPTKLSADNNNHHHHHNQTNNSWHQQQRQQQQQHHYQQQQLAQSNKQQTSQLATHKAAITLGIIMGTFLFCWVPFFCLNIIKAYHGDSIPSSLFRAFTWLGYANSALNPIIYGIHNSEFRNAFNRIFFKHLTLKNGRQYLNRRFSYDLRQHHPNQQQNNRQQHQSRRNHDSQGDQHGTRHGLASAQQQSQFQHQNQRLISSPSPTPTTTCEKDMTYSQTQPAGCDEMTIQQDLNMSKQQQQQHHHDHCEVQP